MFPVILPAQRLLNRSNKSISMDGNDNNTSTKKESNGKDEKKKDEKFPVGLRVWTISRFNEMDSVAIDTFSHMFQNKNFTEGPTGHYNTLGNMGSPRLSHLFVERPEFNYFIFSQPYDFFIKPFSTFHFTNTLSPITNITYFETTSRDDGEDRITAKYAVNMNKQIGFGLNMDYLYGRGYYSYQSTSQFNTTLYGSVIKDQYQAHFMLFSNYLKTAENGGITDDDYIKNPQNFPSNFGTTDIPTNFSKVWNKMYINGIQLTHSYSLGFHKIILRKDSTQNKKPDGVKLLKTINEKTVPDALAKPLPISRDSSMHKMIPIEQQKDSMPKENVIFIPVTSFIHTLIVSYNQKKFLANEDLSDFFTDNYFTGDSTLDKITNTTISNLFAIELREGFNKWALAGVRLFAQHDLNHYSLPSSPTLFNKFNENRLTLGGMLLRRKGKVLNYNLLGQVSSDGSSWGEFELRGNSDLKAKILGDSINLNLHGSVLNQRPTFFYRHFQSKYLWWDNENLNKQFTTRLGAILSNSKTKTKISFDIENIKNYTYFNSIATSVQKTSGKTITTTTAQVLQAGNNIQLLSLVFNQDFKWGILNWENEAAYQTTTDKEVLPLPAISAYSNLYLLFPIAKVLRVEFGGDVRYFSSYYAPTYNAALGMYTNQASANKIKIGNYPLINVYANFHLKHTRFYIMYSHVNYSSDGGSSFLAPHYPINPRILKLGLSWNFFN